MDKLFLLENDNVDSSQKNVVFLGRGDKASTVMVVAGMYVAGHFYTMLNLCLFSYRKSWRCPLISWGLQVDRVDRLSTLPDQS